MDVSEIVASPKISLDMRSGSQTLPPWSVPHGSQTSILGGEFSLLGTIARTSGSELRSRERGGPIPDCVIWSQR